MLVIPSSISNTSPSKIYPKPTSRSGRPPAYLQDYQYNNVNSLSNSFLSILMKASLLMVIPSFLFSYDHPLLTKPSLLLYCLVMNLNTFVRLLNVHGVML